jgi:hypothetical protein
MQASVAISGKGKEDESLELLRLVQEFAGEGWPQERRLHASFLGGSLARRAIENPVLAGECLSARYLRNDSLSLKTVE